MNKRSKKGRKPHTSVTHRPNPPEPPTRGSSGGSSGILAAMNSLGKSLSLATSLLVIARQLRGELQGFSRAVSRRPVHHRSANLVDPPSTRASTDVAAGPTHPTCGCCDSERGGWTGSATHPTSGCRSPGPLRVVKPYASADNSWEVSAPGGLQAQASGEVT